MNAKKLSIRYGSFFKMPRRLFKRLLSAIYPLVIKLYPLPEVRSISETIATIQDGHLSICRFGDGELLYIAERRSLPFQKQDERLRQYLMTILKSNEDNILVGLPIGFHSLDNLKLESRRTWRAVISWTYPKIKKYLNQDKVYYNASITRLYMDYQDKSMSDTWFRQVMGFWTNRDVVLFEGEKSRLGVGNDLFDNARSLNRVLGPAHEAFVRFDDLLDFGKQLPKDKLILVAMGPTAKVLCFALALQGYQCIDIGNLDVEYEWFLRGAREKVKIQGKYTSEAKGGRNVEEIESEDYKQQIMARFL